MKFNKKLSSVSAPAILIIDDDFIIREALTDILSLFLKMNIITAINGKQGLQIIQQQSVALVILDLNMPGMNGEQTYEKLQKIAPQIKVIISSSLSLTEARSRFGERQLPTFLQKPYDIDTLLNVVQAELALVQVDKSPSLPQNGKNGGIDKRAKTEPKRLMVEHEASQWNPAPNPYIVVAQLDGQSMKLEDQPKRQTTLARRTYKTKETFLRLRKQNTPRKQASAEQLRPEPANSRALMVWADDGGQIA